MWELQGQESFSETESRLLLTILNDYIPVFKGDGNPDDDYVLYERS